MQQKKKSACTLKVTNVDWNEIQLLSSCSASSVSVFIVLQLDFPISLCFKKKDFQKFHCVFFQNRWNRKTDFYPGALNPQDFCVKKKKGLTHTDTSFCHCFDNTATENNATPTVDIHTAEARQWISGGSRWSQPTSGVYVTCDCL